jgi:flagellar biosynthetic protein FliQ
MTPGEVTDLLRLAVWTVFVASSPALLAAMIVGTGIAVLQALTQVQEVTLTFVPKIVAVLIAVTVTSGLIGASVQDLAEVAYGRIAQVAR